MQDKNRILGTATGALLGGVLGNQVGEGSGKKLATVAGAVAGGYAGNKVQQNAQAKNTYTTTEQKCHTVIDTQEIVEGYQVSYRLGDKQGKVRMDQIPGDRIPVQDGQLVLNEPGKMTPLPINTRSAVDKMLAIQSLVIEILRFSAFLQQ